MKEIKHTIYFQSKESKEDFLDFAYSEDFTKAWDRFDEKKKSKEQNNDLTPVWDIDKLLPTLDAYIDKCTNANKHEDYINALVDVYEFIERSFKCIDDNCTPSDTDIASTSPVCDILPELQGCDAPYNDVLKGESENKIHPHMADWHEKCMKVLDEKEEEREE